ncbi:unnamed protein product [Ambrosiozyma monospora]|uniref:Unnamed protein product n=1 Tax=Ambrosiozyma monospora TaxID=43982 RepID=A0ACB5U9Q6_AMBMO|nr:unnamed protein product [Ambrosiozyma monospora]
MSASSSSNNSNINQPYDQSSAQQKTQVGSRSVSPVPLPSLKDEFSFEVSKPKPFKQPLQRIQPKEQYQQPSQYQQQQAQQKQQQQLEEQNKQQQQQLEQQNKQQQQQLEQQKKQQQQLEQQQKEQQQQSESESHLTAKISNKPGKHPFSYSSDSDSDSDSDIVDVSEDTEFKPDVKSSVTETSSDEEDAVLWVE